MTKSDEQSTPPNPRDMDANTGDRVEKAPKQKESPQQTHDDENHG